jgi:site-specific DNA-adenine methylase
MNKRDKTPLRWVGGKSRALHKLEIYNPPFAFINEIRDAFLGGGSYPLYLSQMYPEKKIWVNDIYWPLYNFWIQLRDNVDELVSKLTKMKEEYSTIEDSRLLFTTSKQLLNGETTSDIDKAVLFYVINKCSFSGLTENSSFSGGASQQNFKMNLIHKLKDYSKVIQRWKITNLDYTELMKGDDKVFLYLDPPYDIKSNVYGKKGDLHKIFNHTNFIKECLDCKCKLLISYNKEIDGLNNNEFQLTYTMKSNKKYIDDQKKRNEIAITNY